jgi:hypothetical protein
MGGMKKTKLDYTTYYEINIAISSAPCNHPVKVTVSSTRSQDHEVFTVVRFVLYF